LLSLVEQLLKQKQAGMPVKKEAPAAAKKGRAAAEKVGKQSGRRKAG
jgi:hypothetical protein